MIDEKSLHEAKEKFIRELKKENFGRSLHYLYDELKDDKEVVLEAVKKAGWELEYASSRLRDDKEVVTEAVKKYGWALKYASEILRNDKEVVLEALKQDGWALKYASERLQNDLYVLSLVDEEILEELNLLDVYEALILEKEMKEDLKNKSTIKQKLRKF